MCKQICYKVEFKPTKSQIITINKTLGTCRFVYNRFIGCNKKNYENGNKEFITGYDFSKRLNQVIKERNDLNWIKESSSKAITESILNAEKAYKRFFKGLSGYPRFKSKKNSVQSYFFIKNQVEIKKSKIKVPILGWLKLKEKDYIKKNNKVTSGRIIKEDDKYFVMLICKRKKKLKKKDVINIGLGIDVGIKNYLTIANNYNNNIGIVRNFNKDKTIKEIEEKIKQYQQIIANKIEINKKRGGENLAIYNSNNILKLRKKIRELFRRLRNIRNDNIKKICDGLTKIKLKYITIEDLSNENILQEGSHKLSDNWAKCKFYYFRTFLAWKCEQRGIELRISKRNYPSSKTCSKCGHINKNLTLSDRIYICPECGMKLDRDANAAINLLNTNKYSISK